MNLFDQLAAAHVAAEASAAARRKQQADWEERKASGLTKRRTGLNQALRERLPTTKEDALLLDQIRGLLLDIEYVDSGLSAALTHMTNQRELARFGGKSQFRYYRLQKGLTDGPANEQH